MLVVELLKYAACRHSSESARAVADALANAADAELQWALDGGLGPLAYQAVRTTPDRVPQSLEAALHGADLAARVLHEYRVETAVDVVDLCLSIGAQAMLLKGISISEQLYPAPHLRSMSDIDILPLGCPSGRVEGALLELGFTLSSIDMGTDAAHGTPLRDDERKTWVEIHSSLFPLSSPLQRSPVLAKPWNPGFAIASQLRGRPVIRLCDEAQLLYIAAYWTRDLSMVSMHPTLITPLLDAVILLGRPATPLNWDRLTRWLGDDQATTSLYLLLSCLAKHKLIALPPGYLDMLAAMQSLVGTAELHVIQALLDRHLLGARPMRLFNSWHVWLNLLEPEPRLAKTLMLPWRIAFPPTYPDRFQPKAQLTRLLRWIGR